MKDKNTAAILALFAGVFGVHRFYLRQPGLGILYIFLMFFAGFSALLGFIDFIVLLSMSNEEFDRKYNRDYFRYDDRRDYRQADFDRPRSRRRERSREREDYPSEVIRKYPRKRTPPKRPKTRTNPHRQNGIQLYRSYDYEGAIEEFKKALSIDPEDMATHFNIACAYSLLEEKEKAFFHLSKAVQSGFNDFSKINTHDALAYLRIQDEFDNFVDNGYRLGGTTQTPGKPTPEEEPKLELKNDLLSQLKQLGELKEKGLLTEEEFQAQKQKLLNRD